MKKSRTPEPYPMDDLTAALAALEALGVEIVERCPESDCAVCGPVLTAAA